MGCPDDRGGEKRDEVMAVMCQAAPLMKPPELVKPPVEAFPNLAAAFVPPDFAQMASQVLSSRMTFFESVSLI